MFGVRLSKMGSASKLGLVAKAIAILRKYGADAHVYLPGIGTVNGLTAGNYLDSAGTTAATVDNPVGLSLDALQAMTLGPQLITGDDSTFTSGTGSWTSSSAAVLTAVAGLLCITSSGTSYPSAELSVAGLVVGQLYVVTGSMKRGTCPGNASIGVSGVTQYNNATTVLNTISFDFVATATTHTLFCQIIGASAAGETAYFDSITLQQIPGVHATQATTANKPILRRGLLNLLTQSNDPSNATSWPKVNVTAPASVALAPDGTTCYALTDDATNADHKMRQDVTVSVGTVVTFVAVVKAGTAGYVWLYDGYANSGKHFNLATQSSLTSIGTAPTAFSTADLGDGWAMYTITYTASTSTRPELGMSINGSTLNYIGSGSTVLVDAAGLFQGTYTAQQIIDAGGIPLTTSAAASNPNAGKYSWQFDGSNDSLLTGNLGITNTVTVVIAGVLNTLPAVSLLVCEDANGARLGVSSTGAVSFDKNGVAALVATAAGVIVAGVPFVLTARLQAGNADIRKAGAQIATAASALTFSASAGMRIGTRFDGVTYPCNGSIYSIDVITATTTDSGLLTLERLAAQMAGVSI